MMFRNSPDRPFCICLIALLFSFAPLLALPSAAVAAETESALTTTVTLEQAITQAFSRDAGLKAGEAAIGAAVAREHQAGFLSNPEVEVEVEDVGLSGSERGLGSSTYTVSASQTVQLGGKRARRQQSASLQSDLAHWDRDSERLDLVARVKARFIDLLAAQERVRMMGAAFELGKKVRDIAAERVRFGKVSPLELTKADVQLAAQRIALHRTERRLDAAKIALASLWAASPSEAVALRAAGDLQELPQIPDVTSLEAALSQNPDLARWETETELAEAIVDEERAKATPDITISAGLVHEGGTGNELMKFAISVPLPLFDRNQGNIAAALAEADRARHRQHAIAVAMRSKCAEEWQDLQATLEEATAIETEILPAARNAFDAAREGYQSGKLEYLDVLGAQQTLFDAEMQWLDALSALHQTAAELERFQGINAIVK